VTAVAARPRADTVLSRRYAVPAILAALVALSLYLRTRQLNAGFWIDEGLSVGIAHHHWTSIPGLLRQDGSPPAYYLLLGLWIRAFGDGERATHTLSLLFGLGCIPLAYATARSIFDRATGLFCATLAALDPYLTYYGQETRMYELEAFLSLVVAYAYVQGVLRGRRLWAVVLVPALDLMLYTHNWALFLCVGLAVATALFAHERLKPFAVVAAGVALLYLPWAPILLSQVRHTGAPWSTSPSLHDLVLAPDSVLTGEGALVAFALVGGAGLAAVVRRRTDPERTVVLCLLTVAATAIALAWISAQISPAWTTRYFAIVLGPLLLVAGRGLERAGRLGLVALAVVTFLWAGYSVRDDKENARQVTAGVAAFIHPGELVVSTHPEQVPVLRYYLGGGYRWETTLGPVPDPRIFDWRDVVDRLKASSMRARVAETLAGVRPGGEFVVVTPVFRDYRAWKAEWTHLVWERSIAYTTLLRQDPRVRLVHHVASDEIALHRNYFKPLQAFVYRRVG
jgi:mannosyltransferase